MSDDPLRPRDHAEAVALFRAEVIGALAHRELTRGELASALRHLSTLRFRPPGSDATRLPTHAASTSGPTASTRPAASYPRRDGGLDRLTNITY